MDIILRYRWQGNVRELENAIEYAFARTKDQNIIQASKLPPTVRQDADCNDKSVRNFTAEKDDIDLKRLLEKHHWNKTKVAKELGIGRSTLWRMLKKINLQK